MYIWTKALRKWKLIGQTLQPHKQPTPTPHVSPLTPTHCASLAATQASKTAFYPPPPHPTTLPSHPHTMQHLQRPQPPREPYVLSVDQLEMVFCGVRADGSPCYVVLGGLRPGRGGGRGEGVTWKVNRMTEGTHITTISHYQELCVCVHV